MVFAYTALVVTLGALAASSLPGPARLACALYLAAGAPFPIWAWMAAVPDAPSLVDARPVRVSEAPPTVPEGEW